PDATRDFQHAPDLGRSLIDTRQVLSIFALIALAGLLKGNQFLKVWLQSTRCSCAAAQGQRNTVTDKWINKSGSIPGEQNVSSQGRWVAEDERRSADGIHERMPVTAAFAQSRI